MSPQDGKRRSSWRRILAGFILLGLLACGHLVFLGTSLLNPTRIRRMVEEELRSRLGAPVSIGNLEFRLPDTLEVQDLASYARQVSEGTPWLRVRRLHLQVDLLELLQGRLAIQQLQIERPQLLLDFKAPRPAFGLPIRADRSSPHAGQTPSPIPFKELSIQDGAAVLLHVPGFRESEEIAIDGLSTDITHIAAGPHRGLRITGVIANRQVPSCRYRLDIDLHERTASGDIDLRRIDSDRVRDVLPLRVRDLLDTHRMAGSFDASGRFRIHMDTWAVDSFSLDVSLRDGSANPATLPYPLTRGLPCPITAVSGELTLTQTDLRVRHITARLDATRLRISGRRTLDAERPEENWQLDILDLPVDNRLRQTISPLGDKLWESHSPSGYVSAQVEFSRSPGAPPRVVADFRSDNLTVMDRQFRYPAELRRGHFEWDGKEAILRDLELHAGQSAAVLQGTFDTAEKKRLRYSLKFTNAVLDTRFRDALEEYQKRIWDRLSPWGTGDGEYEYTRDAEARRLFRVNVSRSDAGGTFVHFPLPVRVVRGSCSWDNEVLRLQDVQLSRDPATFQLDGSFHAKSPREGDRITITLRDTELDAALRKACPPAIQTLWDQLHLSGKVEGEVQLHGGADGDWRYLLRLAGKEATLCYTPFPYAAAVTTCSVEWDRTRTQLHQFECQADGASVTGRGEIVRDSDESMSRLHFAFRNLKLDDKLAQALPKEAQAGWKRFRLQGQADGLLEVEWNRKSAASFSLQASGRDAEAVFDQFAVPVTPERMHLSWGPESMILHSLTGKIGDGSIHASGGIPFTPGKPSRLEITGKEVRLTPPVLDPLAALIAAGTSLFRLQGGHIKEFQWQVSADNPEKAKHEFTALLEEGTVSYAGIVAPFSNVSARIRWNGDQVEIGEFQARLLDGLVAGSAIYEANELRLAFTARDFTFDPRLCGFFPATFQQDWEALKLTGSFDLDATLESTGEPGGPSTVFQGDFALRGVSAQVGVPMEKVKGALKLKGSFPREKPAVMDGRIDFSEATIAGEAVKGLSATFERRPDSLTIKELRMNYGGGLLRAQIQSAGTPPRTRIDLSLADVNIARFRSRFGTETQISGTLRGEVDATFPNQDPSSLTGSGKLFVEGGDLWKVPSLDLIFGLLKAEKENRVRGLETRFDIEGPKLKVHFLKLVADQCNIYGTGEITFDWNLDLTLFVAKRSLLTRLVDLFPETILTEPLAVLLKKNVDRLQGQFFQVELKGPAHEAKPVSVPFKKTIPDVLLEEMRKDMKG